MVPKCEEIGAEGRMISSRVPLPLTLYISKTRQFSLIYGVKIRENRALRTVLLLSIKSVAMIKTPSQNLQRILRGVI